MSFNASNTAVDEAKNKNNGNRFSVRLAENADEIEQCLRLRYRIFAQEMGARLSSKEAGIDQDRFDDYCKHLMVFDNDSGNVIATTRLLLSEEAEESGLFYSETEFDLELVLKQNGRFMEVGRTCIDPGSRKGSVLAVLWQGIAKVVIDRKVDFLIGCASISLRDGDTYINSVMNILRKKHFSPNDFRVTPLVPLRMNKDLEGDVLLPALLKGYLRQGAMICGEPHWDAEFNVADVFVLLPCEKMTRRYQQHFFERV